MTVNLAYLSEFQMYVPFVLAISFLRIILQIIMHLRKMTYVKKLLSKTLFIISRLTNDLTVGWLDNAVQWIEKK